MSGVTTITRALRALSKGLAMAGGLLLLFVTALVVLSVTGRAFSKLGLGPIPGDFELVEAATALAIFCFLPWCQMERAHVSVDVLAEVMGPRVEAVLMVVFDACMTAAALFILWRMSAGMLDKMQYNETSYILQYPVWWTYAVCLPVGAVFAVVSAWTTISGAIGLARPAAARADGGR